MSMSVPVCSGKCRKGAPDPACPLHGKGGKGFSIISTDHLAEVSVGEWVCIHAIKDGQEPRVRWTPL